MQSGGFFLQKLPVLSGKYSLCEEWFCGHFLECDRIVTYIRYSNVTFRL
jgi:hypothetical protein